MRLRKPDDLTVGGVVTPFPPLVLTLCFKVSLAWNSFVFQDECLRQAVASNNEKNWRIAAAMVNLYRDHVETALRTVPTDSDNGKRGELVVRYRIVSRTEQ